MISFETTKKIPLPSNELDLFISVCIKIFSTLLYESEQYENIIKKCIEVDLSKVNSVNVLSIHNNQNLIDEQLFSKVINEELKYILMHYKLDIQSEGEKIYVLYLLSKLIKVIINKENCPISRRIIKEMCLIITDEITVKKSTITDYSSLYCFFTIITKCWNYYNKEIIEVLKKEISIGTDIFLYKIQKWLEEVMLKIKENVTSNCEAPLTIVDKLQEKINILSVENKVIDSQLIFETYQYIQSIQNEFINIINYEKTKIEGIEKFPINLNDMETFSFIVLQSNITISYSKILKIINCTYSLNSEIRAILNQDSFRKTVYEIFASKTMQNYFHKTTQKMNEYNEFIKLLGNKTQRDLFFENSITLITLPKNIMVFTNRFRSLVLNDSGIKVVKISLKGDENYSPEDIALVKQLTNRYFDEENKEIYLFTVTFLI